MESANNYNFICNYYVELAILVFIGK